MKGWKQSVFFSFSCPLELSWCSTQNTYYQWGSLTNLRLKTLGGLCLAGAPIYLAFFLKNALAKYKGQLSHMVFLTWKNINDSGDEILFCPFR